eukprot:150206_1
MTSIALFLPNCINFLFGNGLLLRQVNANIYFVKDKILKPFGGNKLNKIINFCKSNKINPEIGLIAASVNIIAWNGPRHCRIFLNRFTLNPFNEIKIFQKSQHKYICELIRHNGPPHASNLTQKQFQCTIKAKLYNFPIGTAITSTFILA